MFVEIAVARTKLVVRDTSLERIGRNVALVLIVAAHAWAGWILANPRYLPPGATFRPAATDPETLLVLSFAPSAAAVVASTSPRSPREARRRQRQAFAATAAGAATDEGAIASEQSTTALDLRLAPAKQADSYRQDRFAHRSALDHASTRFDHAWMSEGNAVDELARRSVVASVILGAMGALRKPCTERQRILSDPACVPDQYVYVNESLPTGK